MTSGQTEQLLAVPKISRGTGEEQSQACIHSLNDWKLEELVQGLMFDTTAANTGLRLCACTLIEKAIGRELAWIACRHQPFEVMLAAVFSAVLGPSCGPEIKLFQRFRKMWPIITYYP